MWKIFSMPTETNFNSPVSNPMLTCISCTFPDPSCSYNNVHISPRSTFIVQECLGPGIPFSRVINLQTLSELLRMDNNARLSDSVKKFSLPKVKHFSVPLPHSKVPASVRLFLPEGFREKDEFSFPLVVEV